MADTEQKNYLDQEGLSDVWEQIGNLFVRKSDYDTKIAALEKRIAALESKNSTGGETTA